MKTPQLVAIAMFCVTVMVLVAMCMGHDGAVISSGMALVGGFAGYGVKTVRSSNLTITKPSESKSEGEKGS